jgi:hypothetical protein
LIVSGIAKWKHTIEETRKKNEEFIAKMEDGYAKNITSAIDKARAKQV